MSRGESMSESRDRASRDDTRKPSRRLRTLLLVFILIACCIYPFAKIRWAHNRVDTFSNGITVGMPVEVGMLEARAKELDLKTSFGKENREVPSRFLAWEGWAFARWFCEVEFSQGRVLTKKVFFLD